MTNDSGGFWYPDSLGETQPLTTPQPLTGEEVEVLRETLQYFHSVYLNCADGVGDRKAELIRAIAQKHNIKLEDY
jgi:hypothetical protein